MPSMFPNTMAQVQNNTSSSGKAVLDALKAQATNVPANAFLNLVNQAFENKNQLAREDAVATLNQMIASGSSREDAMKAIGSDMAGKASIQEALDKAITNRAQEQQYKDQLQQRESRETMGQLALDASMYGNGAISEFYRNNQEQINANPFLKQALAQEIINKDIDVLDNVNINDNDDKVLNTLTESTMPMMGLDAEGNPIVATGEKAEAERKILGKQKTDIEKGYYGDYITNKGQFDSEDKTVEYILKTLGDKYSKGDTFENFHDDIRTLTGEFPTVPKDYINFVAYRCLEDTTIGDPSVHLTKARKMLQGELNARNKSETQNFAFEDQALRHQELSDLITKYDKADLTNKITNDSIKFKKLASKIQKAHLAGTLTEEQRDQRIAALKKEHDLTRDAQQTIINNIMGYRKKYDEDRAKSAKRTRDILVGA